MESIKAVLLEPAKTISSQIGQFLVNILLIVIILIVGWIVSKLIKTTVTRILRALRIDDLAERVALDDLLAKGGIKYSLSELIGIICYWLSLLVTFVVAINAVGLTIAANLLNQLVLYIPNVIAAIFILILGMFVAALLKNIVHTASVNAGLYQANMLSRLVEVIVFVFVIVIALEQLSIGAKIIELIIGITLGSLGLGFALAMGLGCKDIIGKMVSEFIDKLKPKK